jgi:hypothetical protein
VTYFVGMVYILIGGPRSRQLVDELPSGYRPGSAGVNGPRLVVLEDVVLPAVWDAPDER